MRIFEKLFGAGRFQRAPSRDFRVEDLPATRVQLFFDALRVRWSAMVGQNLLYLLIWLPAVVWSAINLISMQQMAAAAPEGADLSAALEQLMFTYLLVLWPLVAITGPATAGASYVSRNWARGEHSFVASDMLEHARKNWKQALFVSGATGALPLVTFLLWRFYAGMAQSVSALFIVPQAIVFAAALVWLLMLEVIYTLMVTYQLTLRQLLGNALRFALGRLPLFLGVRLLTLAPPAAVLAVLAFFPGQAATALSVGGFFYIAFGLALNRLLYASVSNAVCEKYINPGIGAPVDIGMRTQKPAPWQDEEQDP